MTKVIVSIAEIIDIMVANNLMPEQISEIDISGDTISFQYNTGKIIPAKIEASIYFEEFDKGLMIFGIQTTWLSDKLLRIMSLPQNEYIQVDYPSIIFYIQRFFNDKLKIVQIENIKYENGKFTITTYNQ
ncbi:MAG: hypothetical protein KAU01_02845 [Candidatus Cloacimonetes bacterium]|nr:hypothetical protein [Candidatus Cloacimonadota bacterium]